MYLRFKQCLFILQLLGKECLHCWESFPPVAPENTDMTKKYLTEYGKHLTDPSGEPPASGVTESRLYNFLQKDNGSTADFHARLTLLSEKCSYNQCFMNTCNGDLSKTNWWEYVCVPNGLKYVLLKPTPLGCFSDTSQELSLLKKAVEEGFTVTPYSRRVSLKKPPYRGFPF